MLWRMLMRSSITAAADAVPVDLETVVTRSRMRMIIYRQELAAILWHQSSFLPSDLTFEI